MGTKNSPGAYDCYAKLEPDEPYFLLRGNSASSAPTVRGWAMQRIHEIMQGHRPNRPEEWHQIAESIDCAAAMDAWRVAKAAPAHETQTIIQHPEGKPN